MTFLEHLGDLSSRLKRSLLAFIFAFVAVTSLPNPLQPFGGSDSTFGYNFMIIALIRSSEAYYAGPGFSFIGTALTDPIFAFMNFALVLSFVVVLPYIFHELYGFVTPGLYKREKKVVRKYTLPFAGLFAAGAIFGIVVVTKIVLRVLLTFYAPVNLAPLLPLNSFIGLIVFIPAVTGLAFTFPVYLVPLVELKVLSVRQLSSARKWVYILVALAVGIVNPDPTFISSIPIIVPIYLLYEVTVYICRRIENRRTERVLLGESNFT